MCRREKVMINIWLMGGLGNQLFQINYASYLANLDFEVRLNYYLTQSNCITKILNWSQHEFIVSDYVQGHNFIYESNVLAIFLAKSNLFNHYTSFDISNFHSLNSFGYRQQKKLNERVYFKHNFPQKFSDTEYVMHFRAGDMNDKMSAFKYYNAVLSKLPSTSIKVITNAASEFEVLKLKYSNIEFHIQSGNLLEDFSYMLGAGKFIGAPSTLSWWAAKLSKKEQLFLPNELTGNVGEII
jgi:hypothetical protein